ncbi:hypothetical protein C8R42DRAFT_476166 [Lentinula raphanica]|nr:hypothetical protein C8R42DRAFT_476166 [Lentinula raphanica]
MSLSSLPLELLTAFANEVPRLEDRKSLRLTCKLLGEVLKPHVLSSVTLSIHGHNLHSGLYLLDALVEEKDAMPKGSSAMFSGLSKHIKTLYIDSLCPGYYPESDLDFRRKQDTFWTLSDAEGQVRSWLKIEPPSSEGEELQLLLKPALESLNNLTAIHWRWQFRDPEWTLNTIFECLESDKFLQKLEEFDFCYHPSPVHEPLRIPNIRQVRRLSISGHLCKPDLPRLFQHPILSNNPRLTTLGVCKDLFFRNDVPLDQSIPDTVTDLRLNGLKFAGLEHIVNGNLTSLDLGNSIMVNNSWASLWKILSSQHICLRKLALGHFSRSRDMRQLLRYLLSYSGLESFSLPCIQSDEDDNSDAMIFYTSVLPQHAESLVNLELKPLFESGWCVSASNIHVFRQCKRMRTLSIKMMHRGLSRDKDPRCSLLREFYDDQNRPDDANAVHHLLEKIPLYMPNLEKLTLEPAQSFAFLNERSDSGLEAQFYFGIQRRLRRSVRTFPCYYESCEVLKWVRIYVSNKRIKVALETRDDRGVEETLQKGSG